MAVNSERKLQYFGHIVRQDDTLDKTIMTGLVKFKRKKGEPRTTWMKNIADSTEKLFQMPTGKLKRGLTMADKKKAETEWKYQHTSMIQEKHHGVWTIDIMPSLDYLIFPLTQMIGN